MKNCLIKYIFIIFIYTSLLTTLSGKELSPDNYEPRFIVGIGEALGYNILQAGFNHFVLSLHFSNISINTISNNVSSPWVWDFNSFITNHLGHPYQGVIYFTSARSNNLDFYFSGLNTVLGSVTWEYFMENVQPSINDLIVTTTGGIVLGEMFFRLSDMLWVDSVNPSNILLSSLISPVSSINRTLFKESHGKVVSQPFTGKTYAEYDLIQGFKILTAINYGDVFSKELNQPFEYFSLKLGAGFSNINFLVELFSEGLLKGVNIYLPDSNVVNRSMGLFMGMDFIYGIKKINLAANYLGFGYFQRSAINNKTSFSTNLFLNFIFMGGTNNKTAHDDSKIYSLGIGENIKINIELESIGSGLFSISYKYYGIHLIEDKYNEESPDSYYITGLFDISIERNIGNRLRIGGSLDLYHNEAALLSPGLSLYIVKIF